MSEHFDSAVWTALAEDHAPTTMVQRRVLPESPHNIHVAERRPVRRRAMRLGLKSALRQEAGSQPQGLGFQTSIEAGEDLTTFTIEAASPSDNELFAELANDLAGVVLASDVERCADDVLNRVTAWQSFFSKAKDPFTAERAMGLFAELWVMRDAILPGAGIVPGTLSWHGPDPALQDFQYPELAIEVKSFRGNGPGALRISSEHQLELTGVGRLYLAYLRATQRAVGDGITLGELVDNVRDQVAPDDVACSYFEGQLLSVGWHDSYRAHRSEVYNVRSLEFFQVTEDFPRITSDMLATGVHGAKYKIDRSALDPFLIEESDIDLQMGAWHDGQD